MQSADGIGRLLCVWDLDGTLVDSSHRTMFGKGKVCTSEQLKYWLEMSAKEWIDRDRLLPLSRIQRRFASRFGGVHVVLTARTLKLADIEYLNKHQLYFAHLLHREGSLKSDSAMKEERLGNFLEANPQLIPFLAFDDAQANWPLYKKFGFSVVNPVVLNQALEKVSIKSA